MALSRKHTGWKWDAANSRLIVYIAGASTVPTAVAYFDNATPYITSPVGLTVTTGNLTVTAGDDRVTAGNLRLGAVETFGTTEPTSAVVFKVGTAPAGAITTSCGIFTNGTVMRKILAANTVSNIET